MIYYKSDTDKAIDVYKKAIEINPSEFQAIIIWG